MKNLAIFLHGKESGPAGKKLLALENIALKYDFLTIKPDFSGITNAFDRITKAKQIQLPTHNKLIIIGSSMGGYLALEMNKPWNADALFLMAPAVKIFNNEYPNPNISLPDNIPIEVIAAKNDDIVKLSDIQLLCQNNNLCNLTIADDSHRLSNSIDILSEKFINLLNSINN